MDDDAGEEPIDRPGADSLAEFLVRTMEERERERARLEAEEAVWHEPAPSPPARAPFVAGCLIRLVLLVLLLIVFGVAGLFLLMGGFLQ